MNIFNTSPNWILLKWNIYSDGNIYFITIDYNKENCVLSGTASSKHNIYVHKIWKKKIKIKIMWYRTECGT